MDTFKMQQFCTPIFDHQYKKDMPLRVLEPKNVLVKSFNYKSTSKPNSDIL